MVVLGEEDVDGDVVELGVVHQPLLLVGPAHRPRDQGEGLRRLGVVAHRGEVELLEDPVDEPHVEGPPLGRGDADDLVVSYR